MANDGNRHSLYALTEAEERRKALLIENLKLLRNNQTPTAAGATILHVQRALQKIEAGIGSECDDCSGEIPDKRLEVAPFAVRCCPCQQLR